MQLGNGLLAAQFGGHILIREKNSRLIPEQGMYRVALTVDAPLQDLAGQPWRGEVVIRAGSESPAWRYFRNTLAVLLRESGF